MTPGGKFLLSRTLLHSELWETKPSWWFKVWLYIMANANFKYHNDKLRRGDLLTSNETIWRDCNVKKEGKTADAVDNVLRFLKKTGQITTRKTTRGLIITVRNYDQIQSFENFSNETENDTTNDYGTKQERDDKGTKETNETTYNYLPKSKPFKEQTLGGNPNLGTDTQPSGENKSPSYKEKAGGVTTELGSASQGKQTDPRVIFHTNLKRVSSEFDKLLARLSTEKLQEQKWSLNTAACVKGIQYYLKRYKAMCGKEHPVLKIPQIAKNLKNFCEVVFGLEELNLSPSKIDEVIEKAIDHWYATTSPEANNLNLNHFSGTNSDGEPSFIIDNSVKEVLYDLGILSDKPKEVHLEHIV